MGLDAFYVDVEYKRKLGMTADFVFRSDERPTKGDLGEILLPHVLTVSLPGDDIEGLELRKVRNCWVDFIARGIPPEGEPEKWYLGEDGLDCNLLRISVSDLGSVREEEIGLRFHDVPVKWGGKETWPYYVNDKMVAVPVFDSVAIGAEFIRQYRWTGQNLRG